MKHSNKAMKKGTKAMKKGSKAMKKGTKAMSVTKAMKKGTKAMKHGTKAMKHGTKAMKHGAKATKKGTKAKGTEAMEAKGTEATESKLSISGVQTWLTEMQMGTFSLQERIDALERMQSKIGNRLAVCETCDTVVVDRLRVLEEWAGTRTDKGLSWSRDVASRFAAVLAAGDIAEPVSVLAAGDDR